MHLIPNRDGMSIVSIDPDSKTHGANMGLTWVLSAPDGLHVGPMNLAIKGAIIDRVTPTIFSLRAWTLDITIFISEAQTEWLAVWKATVASLTSYISQVLLISPLICSVNATDYRLITYWHMGYIWGYSWQTEVSHREQWCLIKCFPQKLLRCMSIFYQRDTVNVRGYNVQNLIDQTQ